MAALVPSPAFFALAEFHYEPGTFFPPAQGPGPVGFRVLEGALEFDVEAPVFLTRAGTAQPQTVPSGTRFTVGVDDQLLVPGGVLHSARNTGEVATRTLGLAVFAQAPPQEFPPGITFRPLTLGPVAALPQPPASASVVRQRLQDGARHPVATSDGPTILYLESGTVDVVLDRGTLGVTRAGNPFAPAQQLHLGGTATLAAGDGAMAERQTSAALVAGTPCSVLEGSLRHTVRAPGDRAVTPKGGAARYVYDVWNGGDLEAIDKLFADDYVNHSPLPGQHPGRQGVQQFVSRWRSAFPDLSVTVDLLIAEGDRAVVRWTSRGTHRGGLLGLAPTGRSTAITGITMLTVRDGVVQESWQQMELATLLEQIGAVSWPAPGRTDDSGYSDSWDSIRRVGLDTTASSAAHRDD